MAYQHRTEKVQAKLQIVLQTPAVPDLAASPPISWSPWLAPIYSSHQPFYYVMSQKSVMNLKSWPTLCVCFSSSSFVSQEHILESMDFNGARILGAI